MWPRSDSRRTPPESASPADPGPSSALERIFAEARAIDDVEARSAFVRDACGNDASLLEDVSSLLASAGLEYFEYLAERLGIPGRDDAHEGLVGREIGEFRLEEPIGHGGMGVVYRATPLDGDGPDVALKLLPLGLATEVGRRRFVAEQETLARLEHPGIAAFLDGGVTEDGTPYFVMERVEGRPIHEACGPGDLDRCLARFCDALEAVEAAHAAGIVHRDLKPEHVLVTNDDRVKLLDFGVAKVLDEAGGAASTLTREGGRPLTPRYASPEQFAGSSVTPASDVYSLGVVLYRLLTGEEPHGPSDREVDDSTTWTVPRHDPVPPSRRLAQKSPELAWALTGNLDTIVLKALRPEPDRRYATAGAMRDDIVRHLEQRTILARPPGPAYRLSRFGRRHTPALGVVGLAAAAVGLGAWLFGADGPTAASTSAPSVVVLPLEDRTGDPERAYVASVLGDEIAALMVATGALRVPARTSTRAAGLGGTTVQDVGTRLSASNVLSGHVEASGPGVAVTVRLTAVSTDSVLWESTLRTGRVPLSGMAGEITAEVLHTLGLPGATAALRKGTASEAAYDAYLRGRHLWNARSDPALQEAIGHFRRAIDRDPAFALPWVGLANAWSVRTDVPADEAMPIAKAAVLRALEIDETLAPAHIALARLLQVYEWKAGEAERHYLRALTLQPSHATAHHWYGLLYLTFGGRFAEAEEHLRTARDLDPLSAPIATAVGMPIYYDGRYEEVIRHWSDVVAMHPSYAGARIHLADAYREMGRHGEAVDHYLTAFEERGQEALLETTAEGWAAAGWDGFIEAWKAHELGRQGASPYVVAQLHAAAGDDEGALTWLERALEVRDWELIRTGVDPLFRRVRDDPRFRAVVGAVGFPPLPSIS